MREIYSSKMDGLECSFCKNRFHKVIEKHYSDNGVIKKEYTIKCGNCGEVLRYLQIN